jgi:hypothetical protein
VFEVLILYNYIILVCEVSTNIIFRVSNSIVTYVDYLQNRSELNTNVLREQHETLAPGQTNTYFGYLNLIDVFRFRLIYSSAATRKISLVCTALSMLVNFAPE